MNPVNTNETRKRKLEELVEPLKPSKLNSSYSLNYAADEKHLCFTDCQEVLHDDDETIFNETLDKFQELQWKKYGQIKPQNWIDPFEIYD